MLYRQRLAPAAWIWLATAGSALADEGPLRNGWALDIQKWLLRWGIWYTGIHRFDDGALFGLLCCVILTAFMTSSIGLLVFKTRGVNFTVGWIIGLPVCLASLLAYCWFKPFPTYDDLSWMFVAAGGSQFVVLAIACLFKTSAERVAEGNSPRPVQQKAAGASRPTISAKPSLSVPRLGGASGRQAAPVDREAMRNRMRLATRGGSGSSPAN